MKAHASNIVIALELAIEVRSAKEKEWWGYSTDSAMLAGWKEVSQTLQENKPVELVGSGRTR